MKNKLESTFIEMVIPKKSNIIAGVCTDIHLYTLLTLIVIT